jgi:molecular chaperone GrpE
LHTLFKNYAILSYIIIWQKFWYYGMKNLSKLIKSLKMTNKKNNLDEKEKNNMKESQENVSIDDKTAENQNQEELIEVEHNEDNDNQAVDVNASVEDPKDEKKELEEKLKEMNDQYLRLYAEFDNYRKRTLKEKMELIKSGGEDVLVSILSVMDNFERALKSIQEAKDMDAVKQGIDLIYSNFKEFLNQKGIKEIDTKDQEFNTDIHEAVTKFPVQDQNMKGKVVDVILKGYFLHDKVVRFAKVVIGE